MSYESKTGKKREDYFGMFTDTPPNKANDEQELQRLYKNSKFLKTNQLIRDIEKERWVFLSHSTKDFHAVRYLRNILEDEGLYPLMLFLKCMNDEDELDSLIKREIESRTDFILCDSENAKASKWVQKEVQFIKALDRNYEVINVDNIGREVGMAKAQIQQLSKKSTLILAFDQKHEHLAFQMYTRLNHYSFKLLLAPQYDSFDAKDSYECVFGSLPELLNKGLVSIIIGDWIANPKDGKTQELLSALEMDSHNTPHYLVPIVFEKRIHDLCSSTAPVFESISLIKACFSDVWNRVNDAVDELLTKMLTPSAMIVYIEAFSGTHDDEAKRLSSLLHKTAREDRAGDVAAVAKCLEKGWGCEKDLSSAVHYYEKAQELLGTSIYQEDISRVEKKIEESMPPVKVSLWKRLIALLKRWLGLSNKD